MQIPPVVSIIVPVYNGEKFIAAALKSVLAQTCEDWELIIIDDGSTDRTAEALAQFQGDRRLTVIRQTKQGPAPARNRGLAAARGELVAFLDADDLWEPDYLQQMVETLRRLPSAVAAFAGWQYMDENGHALPQVVVPTEALARRLDEELIWKNALVPSGVVARRHSIEICGGFDEQFSICEDGDLWLRLSRLGKFVAVPEVVIWYRAHGTNTTGHIEQMESERLKFNQKHSGPLTGDPAQWPFFRRRAVGYTQFVSALGYFQHRDTARGIEKIKQALAYWPGLIEQGEFYYELGCAYQKRGYRGAPIGMNLAESAALLRSLLLTELDPPGGRSRRLACWGRACLALAQLALVADDRRLARDYAFESVAVAPLRQKPAAGRALIRSILPARWTRVFRRLKLKKTSAAGRVR